MIAEGDPLKMEALERGFIRTYWAVAESYLLKLVNAKEAADRAAKKPVSSPVRKARARG